MKKTTPGRRGIWIIERRAVGKEPVWRNTALRETAPIALSTRNVRLVPRNIQKHASHLRNSATVDIRLARRLKSGNFLHKPALTPFNAAITFSAKHCSVTCD